MSYSFIVRAVSKAEAKSKVSEELRKVVEAQPVHLADHVQAQAVADAFIDLLPEDDSKGLQVNVHGSVSWIPGGDTAPQTIIGASVGVSASHIERAVAEGA